MTFKGNARLNTSQVGAGRGGGRGGGGMAAGGGAGGLLLLVLYLVFGDGLGGAGGGTSSGTSAWDLQSGAVREQRGGTQAFEHCRTGEDANEHVDCRVIGTVNSLQDFWARAYPDYQQARTVIFQDSVSTGCGSATSQVGPFYCPLDSQVYLDVSFFDQLERLGGDGGALSQMYVVAHEYGHHVQNQTGVLQRAQQGAQGPESGAVRVELQADCFAGVWVAHADGTRTGDAAAAMLEPVTRQQVDSALSAAAAVGDDRIQAQTQGRVTPESWTHGSAAQRQHWFLTGYQSGDPNACDTFGADSLDR